jgi:hypothetical protein
MEIRWIHLRAVRSLPLTTRSHNQNQSLLNQTTNLSHQQSSHSTKTPSIQPSLSHLRISNATPPRRQTRKQGNNAQKPTSQPTKHKHTNKPTNETQTHQVTKKTKNPSSPPLRLPAPLSKAQLHDECPQESIARAPRDAHRLHLHALAPRHFTRRRRQPRHRRLLWRGLDA